MKYLDETGLATLWDKIKKITDELENKQNELLEAMQPIVTEDGSFLTTENEDIIIL